MTTMQELIEKQTAINENVEKVYQAGVEKGKSESETEEIFFTNHGIIYKRYMVVEVEHNDGFYPSAYRNAEEMETFSAPLLSSQTTNIPISVLQDCTSLKSVYLPRYSKFGTYFFRNCSLLEEINIGSEDYPITYIIVNTFYNCPAIKKVNYTGVIPSSLTFQWSAELETESAKHLLQCLVNYIDTDNAFANTISFHNDVWERLKAEGETSPNGNLWEQYVLDIGWNKG